MTTTTLSPTLAQTLWPQASLLRSALLALVGTVILWLSAKIEIPFQPVPLTLQTLAVLTLGIAYGWRLGGATLLLYLAVGALGLPVFAGAWDEGAGWQHLAGPTAGYLAGFVAAALLCGWLAQRGWDRHLLLAAVAMLLGNVVIYALGVAWLAVQIGLEGALTHGLWPFLLGDAVKIALGASLLPAVWKLLGRRA